MDRPRDLNHGAPAASVTGGPRAYTPEAILKVLRRRRWQILLPALVVSSWSAWRINRLPDRYRSEALIQVVPQGVPETFVRSTVTARAQDRLQSITQQILSRTQLEQIIRDFDLYREQRAAGAMEDIVESMRTRDIEIRPVKGDAFRLGFTAAQPAVARAVAERLVALFIEQTSVDRAAVAEGADEFLEAQLEDARRRLADNEARLADYRRRHNGSLPTQLEANVRGLHNTDMQMQALTESLNRDRERHLLLERSLRDATLEETAARAQIVPVDPTQLGASDQLRRAEAALSELRSALTEQHPDIVAMKQTIVELRTRVAAEKVGDARSGDPGAVDPLRRRRLQDLRAELSTLEQQMAQKTAEAERLRAALLNYQMRIEEAPTREAELAPLTRDYETLQQTYRGLLAKKQDSRIAANLERQQTGAHFKVLDPARLPEQPVSPRRRLFLGLGVLAGVGIGFLFAAAVEWADRGLRTAEDVRRALGLPVLAMIPRVRMPAARVRRLAVIVSAGLAICAGAAALAWHVMKQ
jgi:polysaccharide chain length determinant protein (PEP-CTERM system associated)